jgi:hypothetical protein
MFVLLCTLYVEGYPPIVVTIALEPALFTQPGIANEEERLVGGHGEEGGDTEEEASSGGHSRSA